MALPDNMSAHSVGSSSVFPELMFKGCEFCIFNIVATFNL
jgi:hypothetical protein